MIQKRSLACAILLTTPVAAQQFQLGLARDVLDQKPVASLLFPAAADLNGDGLSDLLFASNSLFSDGSWLFMNTGSRFAPVPSANLPAALQGTATFDDIDGDGDLDVIETCNTLRVFENVGNGQLVDTTTRRVPQNLWTFGECAHADIEGDGDVDILLCKGGILVNDGNGVFTDETATRMTTSGFAIGQRMAARDFDGDGDIDFIIMSGLHRNDGAGNFIQDLNANIGHNYGDTPFAIDADLDGDDDILLSTGQLFDNDGNGIFTELANVLPPAQPNQQAPFGLSGIADIDGDGAVDLLVSPTTTFFGDHPSWVPNDGNGTFLFHQLIPLPSSHRRIAQLLAHDLDHDGDNDLVVTDGASLTPSPVEVLYNHGDGTFHNATEIGDLDTPRFYDRQIVDFDNDGDSDVLTGGTLHRNNGRGTFTREYFSQILYGQHYVDLNGDGMLDAIDNDSIWMQVGGMNWAPGQTLLPFNHYGRDIMTMDIDGDQDQDILMVAGSYPGPYTLQVWQNDGAANMTSIDPASIGLGSLEPSAMIPGDFNGDGNMDLALGFPGFFAWGGIPVRLFVNVNNQFVEAPMPPTPWAVGGLHAADVDNDGDLDIVTESSNLPQLYVNEGGLQFTAHDVGAIGVKLVVADANGDGYLDVWSAANGWPTPYLNDGNNVFTAAPQLIDPTQATHPTRDFYAIDLENDGDMDMVAVAENVHTQLQYLVPMWNHLRQLRAPYLTKAGGSFELRLSSHPDTAGTQLALMGVSTGTTNVQLGALGVLGIDLTTAITFVEPLSGNGTRDITIPMPNDPSLIGSTLHAQALLVTPDGMHLTGTVDSVVL